MKQQMVRVKWRPAQWHIGWLQRIRRRTLQRREWSDDIAFRYRRWGHKSPAISLSFTYNFSYPVHNTVSVLLRDLRVRQRQVSLLTSVIRMLSFPQLPVNKRVRRNIERKVESVMREKSHRWSQDQSSATVLPVLPMYKAITNTSQQPLAHYATPTRTITLDKPEQTSAADRNALPLTKASRKTESVVAGLRVPVGIRSITQGVAKKQLSSPMHETHQLNIYKKSVAHTQFRFKRILSVNVANNRGSLLDQPSLRINDFGRQVTHVTVKKATQMHTPRSTPHEKSYAPSHVLPRLLRFAKLKSRDEPLASPMIVLRKRAQEIPTTKQQSSQQDTDELKRRIVETVERTVVETVNRKLLSQSQLSRHLTGQLRTQLCEDLVFERERWGLV